MIPALQMQVRGALSKLAGKEKEQEALKRHEEDIKNSKDFTYTVPKEEIKKVSLKGVFTTNCLKCSFTCHDNCVFSNDNDKSRCSAMFNGYCTMCPGKCHWGSHSNTPHRFVFVAGSEIRTNYDLKRRCKIAKDGKIDVEKSIKDYDLELQKLQAQVLSLVEEARVSIQRLEEIALRPNPLDELKYLDLLIQSEKDQQRDGYEMRVAQYQKIRKNAELLKKIPKIEVEKGMDSMWSDFKN